MHSRPASVAHRNSLPSQWSSHTLSRVPSIASGLTRDPSGGCPKKAEGHGGQRRMAAWGHFFSCRTRLLGAEAAPDQDRSSFNRVLKTSAAPMTRVLVEAQKQPAWL